jgi:acetyl-CoA carboxylase biotin carboxyl carrier protein
MRVDEIRELVELVERSQIDELEVRRWWGRVRIVKNSRGLVYPIEPPRVAVAESPGPVPAPTSPNPAPASPAATEAGLVPIVSPMVGTFYRASSPAAPSYVETGQRVEMGQVVCIVEAMKLMNEIESEVAGTIARILVENGQPVEFNQPLFLVKPD